MPRNAKAKARAKKIARRGAAVSRARRRSAEVHRRTKETDISVRIALDGGGSYQVGTGVPFLNHMLELFARHGLFDLAVRAGGDLDVDAHHTVEDVGLTLGEALRHALGDKRGIRRFGEATVPLDEALVSVVVDLSGRPYLVYNVKLEQERVGTFDVELVHDFLLALVNQVGMNLHVNMICGRNPHHIVEASFKGLARALSQAASFDPRVKGVLSTKGVL
ncbi:MAG: imidazoleglycerol-phosphate dehydratase HisB [Deltaproteobacteria bacterium]|nr:imidazoleglycerol-phosphate dehydratase HisB [Deltaproteobacteria bacterium]